MRLVIIGCGAGGFASALSAVKNDPTCEVTIIEKRPYEMYSPCSMPYAIEGELPLESIKHGISVTRTNILLGCEASRIDTANKRVFYMRERGEESVEYDALIIDTGTVPIVPPIKNTGTFLGRNVFTLSSLEEAEAIQKSAHNARRVVVVGASAIGSEMASVFSRMGKETVVVEFLPWVFPKMLDPDMGALVGNYMKEKGITLMLGKAVSEIFGKDSAEGVIVDDQRIQADLVLIAAGVRANTELAHVAGIELGRWGIRTDEHMRTSTPDVFAVGDCAEVFSRIDRAPTMMQLAISAYRQGLVAGVNATGGNVEYAGALHTNVSVVGGMEVATTGFSSDAASRAGFKVISSKASATTKPSFFPGTQPVAVKLICNDSGTLLGCQVVGGPGSWWRVNVASLAIAKGMTVRELVDAELAYCPPVSDTYDVLLQAADLATRKLAKGRT